MRNLACPTITIESIIKDVLLQKQHLHKIQSLCTFDELHEVKVLGLAVVFEVVFCNPSHFLFDNVVLR